MNELRQKWEDRYARGETPWNTGRPDPHLVQLISNWPPHRGAVLDVGCGTGSDALWLARQGFQVTGLDIAGQAVDTARERAAQTGLTLTLLQGDFLYDPIPGDDYELIFDRGCLHSCRTPESRHLFVQRAAALLAERGLWLCLAGNADAPAGESGPPRLRAEELAQVVEPHFEILELKAVRLETGLAMSPLFWRCLMRKR
jgi:SAM-dependent methyltransferase